MFYGDFFGRTHSAELTCFRCRREWHFDQNSAGFRKARASGCRFFRSNFRSRRIEKKMYPLGATREQARIKYINLNIVIAKNVSDSSCRRVNIVETMFSVNNPLESHHYLPPPPTPPPTPQPFNLNQIFRPDVFH